MIHNFFLLSQLAIHFASSLTYQTYSGKWGGGGNQTYSETKLWRGNPNVCFVVHGTSKSSWGDLRFCVRDWIKNVNPPPELHTVPSSQLLRDLRTPPPSQKKLYLILWFGRREKGLVKILSKHVISPINNFIISSLPFSP